MCVRRNNHRPLPDGRGSDWSRGLRRICLLLFASAAYCQIPVGLDAYRMWDRWPYQRIGVRAYMRSTYDRAGGNENADASHLLYQLAEDRNVTLDVEGPPLARQSVALRGGWNRPRSARD
jgi:hypothetical protein